MKRVLIVNKNLFFSKKFLKNKKFKFFFITKKKELNLIKIKKINPNIIFFPHWSSKIKDNIFKNFNCIGFHSTPLPYGRGGSPIHNMVLKNFIKTQICAFKIEQGLDNGPIYLRNNLSLDGAGHEIFEKMYNQIVKMIKILIKRSPMLKPQKGVVTKFKRLSKNNSEIKKKIKLKDLYNLIRILDMRDDAYENAFIRHKNLKISFKEAKIKGNTINAQVKIKTNS